MAKPQVTLTIGGDASGIEKAFNRVGAGAKDLGGDLDKASADAKEFGSAIDRAADRTDKSERTFMGTADVLDGLGAAFGLPLGRATELGRAAGDLTGGFTSLAPAIKGVGAAAKSLLIGPFGAVAAAIAAVALAVFVLYQKFEWFRNAIDSVISPIKKAFEGLFGGISGGAKFSAEKFAEHMAELKAEGDAARAKVKEWADTIGGHIKSINNPLEEFSANHELTLRKVRDNMLGNITTTEEWVANLKELVARGFTDLAVEFAKLGPETALAVQDAVNRADPELERLRSEFARYGALTGEDFTKELARTLSPDVAAEQSWMAGINEKIKGGGLAALTKQDTRQNIDVRVVLDGRQIHESLLRLQRTSGPLGLR